MVFNVQIHVFKTDQAPQHYIRSWDYFEYLTEQSLAGIVKMVTKLVARERSLLHESLERESG